MKRYLLLLLISITSSPLFAQTNFRFADSTAQWNEVYFQYWGASPDFHTTVYVVERDTVLNGLSYQKINTYFIRQDSIKQVFIRKATDTIDYKVYDFGKPVGSVFYLKDLEDYGADISIRIDSIDSTLIGTVYRKRFHVNRQSWNSDVWIEGIGTIYTHLWSPGFPREAFDGQGRNLLCYFENGQRVFHNDTWQDTCFINSFTAVNELHETRIKVSPNPTTNFITIQSQTNFPSQTTFHLFDITGRMILQKQLTDKTTQVELDEVSKGIYLYNITALEKKMGSGKLVVQ